MKCFDEIEYGSDDLLFFVCNLELAFIFQEQISDIFNFAKPISRKCFGQGEISIPDSLIHHGTCFFKLRNVDH